MIKKITLLFCCLFSATLLFSQKPIKPNTVTLKGTVIDAKTNQPLEYATIVLKNLQTEKVTGGITDEKGSFSVQTPKGTYDISIEYISFKTKRNLAQEITENKNYGIIKLEEDESSLDEIVVIAEKSSVDIRLDKKIYNVGKDMTVKGGNAADVLNNVPSVDVDAEGAISLRGSENVRILIDGKPSALVGLSGADALKQLPSDAIERIEVITSPSARYDSEGTAGILNIILRKGNATGFNGSVSATVGDPKNYQTSVNLNLRSEKINLFSNFGYSDNTSPGVYNSNITYLKDAVIDSTRIENRDNNNNRKSFNANIGLEYFLNKKSSVTGTIFVRDSDGRDISTNNISSFDVLGNNLNNSTRIQNESEIDKTLQFSLNYTNNFNDKGHKLTVDLQHSTNKENQSAIITDVYPETNTTDELSLDNLLQADYVLPIGENSQFELGYRGSFEDLTSDYLVNAPNLDPRYDPSNNLEFKQNVNAFYTQFGSKINKFSYLLGVRAEMTNIDINLVNTSESYTKNYTNFFPTVNFGYEMTEDQSFTLGYSRRLRRPRSYYLNPFESRESETVIFKGNVDLDPTYTNSFDLGYLNRWGKLTLNSSIYYQHSTNDIERVNSQEIRIINGKETNVLVRQPINLASEDRAGFEFTANYNASNKVKLSGSFNFFQFETNGDYTYNVTDPITNDVTNIIQNFDAKNNSWFTRFDAKITLPWDIQSQTGIFYRGARNEAQSDVDGILSVNLAFSKEILNDKGTLVLNVSDLFNSRKYNVTGYAPSRENPTNITDQTFQRRVRQVSLNFSYRFNQKKAPEKRGSGEREEGGGDEF
ncbi:Outer membrane receptor proteins, mostly Fe transport [Polaribacter sp. KT25b]|uniref:TonB-dependent receptor domain-containing protein n=1 Tax=Polaribacter sp. KT25b TaxID=1855336 RepID=UPI00087C9B1F|nr:TonB-dependent receptor [Polaribacter sp. KT25b]SDR85806.1 Outer membrane receptor proteins, mostly Fe transport [Polaribacter sp. KT25b]